MRLIVSVKFFGLEENKYVKLKWNFIYVGVCLYKILFAFCRYIKNFKKHDHQRNLQLAH